MLLMKSIMISTKHSLKLVLPYACNMLVTSQHQLSHVCPPTVGLQ